MMADQQMKAANDTYAGFLTMLKFGTVATVIIAAFVVLLLAS
ncbi:aa3-type cytochrome c oxidase subunit IV [Sphingopyxis sp. MWB1]|nr:aa3-type cytochrome c oxidase subunit IV [Sphingopyxis sp. MWB1]